MASTSGRDGADVERRFDGDDGPFTFSEFVGEYGLGALKAWEAGVGVGIVAGTTKPTHVAGVGDADDAAWSDSTDESAGLCVY
jgi:hypothetical protein